MEAEGCHVYAIPRYRKPKPEEWRCRLVLSMLLPIEKEKTDIRVDNTGAWRDSLSSIFEGFQMRDCTPGTVLDTMAHMKRAANKLEEITIACRSRNIAASDDLVLECLRELYKDGKIKQPGDRRQTPVHLSKQVTTNRAGNANPRTQKSKARVGNVQKAKVQGLQRYHAILHT